MTQGTQEGGGEGVVNMRCLCLAMSIHLSCRLVCQNAMAVHVLSTCAAGLFLTSSLSPYPLSLSLSLHHVFCLCRRCSLSLSLSPSLSLSLSLPLSLSLHTLSFSLYLLHVFCLCCRRSLSLSPSVSAADAHLAHPFATSGPEVRPQPL